MTMVVEHQTRQYGGGMGYDSVYHHGHSQPTQPHYNSSWATHSSASHPPPSIYSSAAVPSNSVGVKREDVARPPPLSMPYSTVSVPAPSSLVSAGQHYSASAYSAPEIMVLPPEIPRTTFEQVHSTTATVASFPPVNYTAMDYAQSMHHQHPPHQHVAPHPAQSHQSQHSPVHADPRTLAPGHEQQSPQAAQQQSATAVPVSAPSYGDALDASRGMVALSQDLAPRNIYGQPGVRAVPRDSYAFPTAHSAGSSISSGPTYPYYSASVSAESSVTDYSSTSDSYDVLQSRTLPRLSGLMGTMPPGPQSMMGQFSSKMPSNAQKKHKCKICDKRFTRPSSLQTHMYSHTGEKPYACDVEGCGRHFSVVSNLRRHKKVHKGEKDTGSPEEDD